MGVGDEIVAIGDTLVCASSYQEICDLMHNLPVTLTLEIQKPVSGEPPPPPTVVTGQQWFAVV